MTMVRSLFALKSQEHGHILKLSQRSKLQFIDSFDMIVIGFEGVLWMLDEAILNALKGLSLLKNAGKKLKFVTEDSFSTDDELIQKLKVGGVDGIKPNDIFQPVKLIAHHVLRSASCPNKTVFSLGPPSVNSQLTKYGLKVQCIEPSKNINYQNIDSVVLFEDTVDAVVLESNYNLSYNQLARACKYLQQNSECEILVGSSSEHKHLSKDFQVLGFSGFTGVLSENLPQVPMNFTKPHHFMTKHVGENLGIEDKHRVLFIGLNTDADITFAHTSGFLLLCLNAPNEKAARMSTRFKPDYVADTMADFIPFFEDLNSFEEYISRRQGNEIQPASSRH